MCSLRYPEEYTPKKARQLRKQWEIVRGAFSIDGRNYNFAKVLHEGKEYEEGTGNINIMQSLCWKEKKVRFQDNFPEGGLAIILN